MSDTQSDELTRAEMVVRINRMVNESLKFQAEQQKLIAEQLKFNAEQQKLLAEQLKLSRDRWLAPVLAIAAVVGGLLGVATFIARVAFHS